jgi:hypothetical protein
MVRTKDAQGHTTMSGLAIQMVCMRGVISSYKVHLCTIVRRKEVNRHEREGEGGKDRHDG